MAKQPASGSIREKKAQIKMGETLGVLIVFFLLIIISLGIYASFQKGAIKKAVENRFEKEAVRIAIKAASLPEITCTQDRDIEEENCIDLYKAESFAATLQDQQAFLFYEADFRTSKIILRQMYPPPAAGTGETVLYNNAPDEGEETRKIATTLPVVIRDPAIANPLQQRSIGLLVVEVYS